MPDLPQRRLLELDALRGLSALAVMLFHFTTRYDELYGHPDAVISLAFGGEAVLIFFMISGFVIPMSLERGRGVRDFLTGRWARLFPLYWLSVLLTYTVVSIAGLPGREVSPSAALINLTLLQDLFDVPRVDGVYWTLELELLFYSIMAVVLVLKWLPHVERIAVAWIGLLLLEELLTTLFGVAWLELLFAPLHWLDYAEFFFAGMLFYRWWRYGLERWRVAGLVLCLAHAIELRSSEETMTAVLGYGIFWLVIRQRLASLTWQPLVFLGSISYPLYLVHQNIGYVVINALYQYEVPWFFTVLLPSLLALGLATVMHLWVECPLMDWIQIRRRQQDRLMKSHSVEIG